MLHKTIEEEYKVLGWGHAPKQGDRQGSGSPGFGKKFLELFITRRLRNALISSSTVNLAQQLCGSKFLSAFNLFLAVLHFVIVLSLLTTVLS